MRDSAIGQSCAALAESEIGPEQSITLVPSSHVLTLSFHSETAWSIRQPVCSMEFHTPRKIYFSRLIGAPPEAWQKDSCPRRRAKRTCCDVWTPREAFVSAIRR